MRLVKLTIEKISTRNKALICLLSMVYCLSATAQDNSPYSRYGIGDIVPSTNITNRGMGRIAVGYNDFLSINFSNPASYALFSSLKEARSNKIQSGRVIFDVGTSYDSRTLREPNNPAKYRAQNLLFSYMQVGLPLRKNWGLSFGLRPVSRIGYKIETRERLSINDSVFTLYTGDGGSYLPNIGTAVRFNKISVGVTAGYLFGKKDYSTRRAFINDTIQYYSSNHQTKTIFGNIFLQGGFQYNDTLNRKPAEDDYLALTIGATGNLGTDLNAKQDIIRETFTNDLTIGNVRIDSVWVQNDIKGKLKYPGSFTFGFSLSNNRYNIKKPHWLIGADFNATSWSNYRFYDKADFTQNSWEVRLGGHYRPKVQKNYFSNVTYRAGFFYGPDYINAGQKLNQMGVTFGMGLPVPNSNRFNNQITFVNLALEYNKRGSNSSVLKEDLFRVSVGLSLSDLWFIKRKFE